MKEAGVDMIVVCSHIAPQFGPELQQIYQAIRQYHPITPLVMLAGHRFHSSSSPPSLSSLSFPFSLYLNDCRSCCYYLLFIDL